MDRKLRVFLAVANAGNITNAADILALTQPAVTKNIKKLEDLIGDKLFTRYAGGVTLTEAGEIFHLRAKKMDMNYRLALEEIAALRLNLPRHFRILAGSAYHLSIAPDVVRQLISEFPGTEFHIEFSLSDRAVSDLLIGEVDLVLGVLFGELPEGVNRQKLLEFDTVPFCCNTNPLLKKKTIDANDLAEAKWAKFEDDRIMQRFFDDYFFSAGLRPPKAILTFTSLAMALSVIAGTDLLLPAPNNINLPKIAPNISALQIETPIWQVSSGAWYRESSQDNIVLKRAIELLKEHLEASHKLAG